MANTLTRLTLYNSKAIIVPHRIIWSWYTGRWWVDCYIWYSEEETEPDRSPPSPLLALPNVTAHPSTASVPITVLLYIGPLPCSFNVPIKRKVFPCLFFVCLVTINEHWKQITSCTSATWWTKKSRISGRSWWSWWSWRSGWPWSSESWWSRCSACSLWSNRSNRSWRTLLTRWSGCASSSGISWRSWQSCYSRIQFCR